MARHVLGPDGFRDTSGMTVGEVQWELENLSRTRLAAGLSERSRVRLDTLAAREQELASCGYVH